jgi:hypothetical protein
MGLSVVDLGLIYPTPRHSACTQRLVLLMFLSPWCSSRCSGKASLSPDLSLIRTSIVESRIKWIWSAKAGLGLVVGPGPAPSIHSLYNITIHSTLLLDNGDVKLNPTGRSVLELQPPPPRNLPGLQCLRNNHTKSRRATQPRNRALLGHALLDSNGLGASSGTGTYKPGRGSSPRPQRHGLGCILSG